ncbi:hypothetical protein [Acidovorax sp. Leaf78]|uniref:hypothetical protein n=1 Tax=unclassified Acidovorax TaxID=2684926 RepID=UPI000A8FA8CC|nr:hypothetical protein [Acidovorax sp. Leaf78]
MSVPAIPSLVFVPSEDPYDPEALYAIATAYARAGLLVSDYGKRCEEMALTFPAVVCSSFALELFLKFFLMVDLIDRGESSEKVSFGHAIPPLWSKVAPAHKTLIGGMFGHLNPEPYSTGPDIRLESFERALETLGKQPFVQWRYAHELKGPQLMSHATISLVVDTFWRAAAYIVQRNRSQWQPGVAPDATWVESTSLR